MGVRVGAAVLGLTLVASAAAATPGRVQRFTTIVKSDQQAPAGISAPPGTPLTTTTMWVAPDVNNALFFQLALTATARAKVEAVDFEHTFLIGLLVGRKTSGYSVTIKRITLQRVSRSKRQFCVTAAITKPSPGTAVVNHLWFTTHIVALSADPYRIDEFHWAIPKAWVLRDPSGKLLAVSHDGTNQHGKPITTGKATSCHA